ncbi:MAG: TonB family protein [Acidobacteriaceae bacterium]|jgi:protein TonB
MFEGSLVESRGMVVSSTQRWTALGSLTFQLAVAGLLLAIPLVRPQILPPFSVAPQLEVPLPVKPPVPVVQTRTASASATAMSVPAVGPQAAATRRFSFPLIGAPEYGPAPPFDPNVRMGSGGPGVIPGLSSIGTGPGPAVSVVRPEKMPGPLPVSRGVTEGMLLAPIQPVYPPIARAAGVQGTVVMEAVISKTGRIESLHALSGPDMLRGAALAAVQAARYRPYLLSGEPTEVQTTITVVFKLGS